MPPEIILLIFDNFQLKNINEIRKVAQFPLANLNIFYVIPISVSCSFIMFQFEFYR
jgi:hypothetical protein